MKKLTLLCAFMALLFVSSAQSRSDSTIVYTNGFFGMQFRNGNGKMNLSQVAKVMQTNPEAYQLISSAKSNNTLATILGVIGGGLVGYPLGTSLGGGTPNWTIAYVGGGLIVGSIPFAISANNKAKKAVEVYNAGPRQVYRPSTSFHLSMAATGLRMQLKF